MKAGMRRCQLLSTTPDPMISIWCVTGEDVEGGKRLTILRKRRKLGFRYRTHKLLNVRF